MNITNHPVFIPNMLIFTLGKNFSTRDFYDGTFPPPGGMLILNVFLWKKLHICQENAWSQVENLVIYRSI